jgi:hypothetical protein
LKGVTFIYADDNYKFIAVLNEKIDLPKLLNAFGHMTAGLITQCEDTRGMHFLRYKDTDGSKHPAMQPLSVHRIGCMVQAAWQSNLYVATNGDRSQNPYNDFDETMLGTSAEDQLEKTSATRGKYLQYFGICLFGPAEVLNGLTRKFSLFKGGRDGDLTF